MIDILISKTNLIELLKGRNVICGNDEFNIKGYGLDSKFEYYGRD